MLNNPVARETESRYRGDRRYREANDPKGKKYQKRQKIILCFPKDTNCGRNNSQGERVVACVCEIIIKGLSGKSLRIFFQFSKIFQGSLKMLFFKPYQPSGIKMRNIVDLISFVVRTKCPYFLKEVLNTTSSLFEGQQRADKILIIRQNGSNMVVY